MENQKKKRKKKGKASFSGSSPDSADWTNVLQSEKLENIVIKSKNVESDGMGFRSKVYVLPTAES